MTHTDFSDRSLTFTPAQVEEFIYSSRGIVLPMNTPFRGVTTRSMLLFEGPYGWGEFSAFLEYSDSEARLWLESGLESAFKEPIEPVRNSIFLNFILPAVPSNHVKDILNRYELPEKTVLKIKAAASKNSLKEDTQRIAAAIDYARAQNVKNLKIRIDANAQWDMDQAKESLIACEEVISNSHGLASLDYVEQPVERLEDLAELKDYFLQKTGKSLSIALDESIRKNLDRLYVPAEEGRIDEDYKQALQKSGDVAILKNAPLGGNRTALKIAQDLEMPIVISSALDSPVGLESAARLAGAVPDLYGACGLSTGSLFKENLLTSDADKASSHSSEKKLPAYMELSTQAVIPDEKVMAKYAMSAEEKKWWDQRVRSILVSS